MRKMEARPRLPLRLSVEERVENAVQEAVRKALAEQRRTQEKELDNLSDALQKSLAALAGERDRALRSLAVEEDKRNDLIEELSAALGDELPCSDVSRLVMGLERIEQERAALGEEDEEGRHERVWVLEQLRQCLYARAAAQDHLRSAAEEVATDFFEAEELADFDPTFAGQHAQGNAARIFPTSAGDENDAAGSAESFGVPRARVAASQALFTSIRIARERLEYLERLARDVKGGACTGPSRGTTTDLTIDEHKERSATPAAQIDGLAQHGQRTRGEDRDEKEDSWSGPGALEGGGSVSGIGMLLSSPEGECLQGLRTERPQEAESACDRVDDRDCEGTEEQNAQYHPQRGAQGGKPVITCVRRVQSGDAGRGGIPPVRGRIGLHDFAGSSELPAEAKRWKMAAHHAEASLVDLRQTLGEVVALSFRCGEERSRQEIREVCTASVAPKDGALDDGRDCEEDNGESSGGKEECVGQIGHQQEENIVGVRKSGSRGSQSEDAGELDKTVGGLGPCCGQAQCSSCEARAKAVGALLERLDALFADQAENIAQMASCLDLPRHRHREDPNAPAVTVRSRRGEWSRSPNDRVRDRGEAEAAGATASRASSERLGPGAEEILPVDERIDQERDGEPTTPKNEDDHKSAVSLSLSSTSSVGFKPERGVHENQEAGRGGGGEGKDTEGQSQEAAPKKDVRTEWEELEGLETHLARYQGSGGLGSSTVQGVLDRWIDVSKRRILEGWLAHVLHGGPVDAANGCFVPRVQISSLSKEVRDGLVTAVLPLLLGRRGVLLQVLTRQRVELVHDIQIRVTPVAGRRDAPLHARAASTGRRRAPVGEREHGARIRDMVMKAAHAGYVEEDDAGGDGRAWRTPIASVDLLSRQLKDTWENFNANFANKGEPRRGAGGVPERRPILPEH